MKYVVIYGTIAEGFSAAGTFDSVEEGIEWAEQEDYASAWEVLELNVVPAEPIYKETGVFWCPVHNGIVEADENECDSASDDEQECDIRPMVYAPE